MFTSFIALPKEVQSKIDTHGAPPSFHLSQDTIRPARSAWVRVGPRPENPKKHPSTKARSEARCRQIQHVEFDDVACY